MTNQFAPHPYYTAREAKLLRQFDGVFKRIKKHLTVQYDADFCSPARGICAGCGSRPLSEKLAAGLLFSQRKRNRGE